MPLSKTSSKTHSKRWSISSLWRLARTVFAAAVFAVWVPLLVLIALPMAHWQSRSASEREIRMQRAAHRACRLYLRFVERLGILRLTAHRTERLGEPGPHLVVANHPTLIDVLVLLAFMPQADCIVSGDRAKNWLLRGMIAASGYVSNDGATAVVEACAQRLRQGRSLIVFPEGTRSPPSGLHPFRRGAAHIALAAGCELLPVAIQCDPPALGKNQKWYDVPDRAFTVAVTVIDPISAGNIADGDMARPLAARHLTRQLREALAKGLNIVDVGNP